jgi:putative intracellular protease/amidase
MAPSWTPPNQRKVLDNFTVSRTERAPVPTKAVYLLVVPGFADWEPAHALAELRRQGGYRVEVVGFTTALVESMGGVRVQPSRGLADVDPIDVAVFILPGGDRWEKTPMEPELVAVLGRLDAAGVPLAAICGATVAVARAGLLRGRRHTSNGRAYLEQQVPGYEGGADYVEAPAVRDRGLITASGLADVEFAAELLTELGVFNESKRKLWTDIFRSGRVPGRTG